jgi:phosphotransferase system HPr-like phosphotransfer protein
MPTAILLISDQNLPNVLFIKQMGPFDKYVFLTTEQMENKGQSYFIIHSARLHQDQVMRLKIDAENPSESLAKLKSKSWPKNEPIAINLTGGTKMMALAAYAFFAPKSNVHIYYIPINSPSLLVIHPDAYEIPLNATVSFDEYLHAYGTVIQSQNANWSARADDARQMMDSVQGKGHPELLNLSTPTGSMGLNAEDRRFFTGEWLEVWLAWAIHSHWSVPESDIRVGVHLNRINVSAQSLYEYDVMFIRNNRLYAAECKFFNSQKFNLGKINKELFKFAAMNTQLGLYAKPFFVIANEINQLQQKKALKDQCDILHLPYPADIQTLSDRDQFCNFLKKL